MNRLVWLFVICVLIMVCSTSVWAMASEYDPKNPIVQYPRWPGEVVSGLSPQKPGEIRCLADVLNSRKIVYGYFVNWHSDFFYYTGDTKAFNDFVELYSKLHGTEHWLVIHVGPGLAGEYGIPDKATIPCDWEVEVSFKAVEEALGPPIPDLRVTTSSTVYPAVMHLWLGRNIELSKIKVPSNVKVVSGGEIEKLIAERDKAKTDTR